MIVELGRKGYTSIKAVDMPLTSLADDAERTRKMIAQEKGPVLLVGHSYGGAVITEVGDQPNVVGLVYIAAFAPDSGESPGGITQEHPPLAMPDLVANSDGFLWVKPEKFHESFGYDLTPEVGLVLGITQKAPLASTLSDTVAAPAWKKKPSWYQISSEDRMTAPENQHRTSARMGARKIVTLAASHASLLSKPAEIAALIDEAAADLRKG